MTVPTRHRDSLRALCQGQLTMTKHPEGCLLVFPRPAWETFREKVMALPMSASGWRRVFLGNAVDVDFDSADRILISPELRTAAGLGRDILLMGMGSHFELWDVARHAAQEADVMAGPLPDALQNLTF